jgi:hypothetical protein
VRAEPPLQARPGRSGEFTTLPSSRTASDYDLCEEPMSLADVCHDQVLAIVEARAARDGDLVIKGVRELIEGLYWYATDDSMGHHMHNIYHIQAGDQFDALRRAAQRVIDRPDDECDLLWLLALAECVRRLDDCAFDDDEIGGWCAWYLRGREDHFAGRCRECGAEDGEKRIRLRRWEVRDKIKADVPR